MKFWEIGCVINNNIFKKKKNCLTNLSAKSIIINKKLLQANVFKNVKIGNVKIISSFSVYKNSLKIKKIKKIW